MKFLHHIGNFKKKVRGLRLLPFYLFAVLFLTISCYSIDCPVENVVATVYKPLKSDGTADTIVDTLTILSRRINGTDTTLLDHKTQTTLFQLPVGYTNPEDTLIFCLKDTATKLTYYDTLYIKKENEPHFESVDCNISFFHTINATRLSSHNVIDSIAINKKAVNYDLSTEHFRIYFKARH